MWLRQVAPCASLARVAKDQQISVRLDGGIGERAEALAESLAELPEFQAFRLTRATVLRMAMIEGLAVLEQRLAEAKAAKPKR